VILFFTTFIGVFLLGFQQQNVQHGHYKMAAVTSSAIALTQYLMIINVVSSGWIGVLYMAIGGSMGITFSMYVHRKWRKNKV